MENYSFQDYLRYSLHQLFPNSKDDGARNNVLINCPLCIREGRADTNHHMSISLGNEGKPLLYNCFRNTSHRGILTSDVLIKLTQDYNSRIDPILLESIDNYNKQVNHYSRYKLNIDSKLNIDNNIRLENNDSIEMKRQYICNRIGLNLSIEELLKNKIIFSLKDLLWKNYITKYTRDPRVIEGLDKYFIGFLSNNNSAVTFRNTVYNNLDLGPSLNYRYIKYLIIQGSSTGYYIIPSICDITKRNEVIISEGHFDILSIFYNLYNGDRNNKVYGCIGGNSYLNMIKYILCEIGLINPIFHIYIDNDINKSILINIKKVLYPLGLEIYIHMNGFTGEKDFGVAKEKIKDYSYRLI